MKTTLTSLLLIFVCYFFQAQTNLKFDDHSIIVQMNPAIEFEIEENMTGIPALDRLNQEIGLAEIRILNKKYGRDMFSFSFSEAQDINRIVDKYEELGLFKFVEPNYLGQAGGYSFRPNDDFYDRQWGLYNDGSFALYNSTFDADAQIEEAWDITKGSSDIVIAVLDSGIKFDHPEFSGRIWNNSDETTSSNDADNNGYGGDTRGYDFANIDNDPTDDQGHGTNVTGILGAKSNNSEGYAGVDWNAKIMPLKILDSDNSGFYSWWIEAIYYATDNGAHVLNMSVGGSGFSAGMQTAIDYANENGVTVVACMMNENNSVKYYPAAYDGTIAIGSTNPDDTRSDAFPWNNSKGSNYGDHIDLSAPGNYIYGLSSSSNSNYNTYWSGTSQATPHVVGVVGLLLSLNPDLSPDEIRNILRESADDEVGRSNEDLPGWDKYHGAGRLNALSAVSSVIGSNTKEASLLNFKLINSVALRGTPIRIQFENSEFKTLSVLSISGQLVKKVKINSEEAFISTDELSSGSYLLKVSSKEQYLGTLKFIVQ